MKCRLLLIAASLVALTLLVFLPVRNFGFINYDDGAYVTENRHVSSGLTWENVVWAFRPESCEATSNWHPLTWLSLMTDVALCGVNGPCMHLVNLLLHTVNVLLLFALLVRMTGAEWPSAFVAAVFAIHPLHVESVAWISERKDVLSTCFALLTLLAHTQYVVTRQSRWLVSALAAYILSLLSKQMYVTLPFLLLVLDYWPLRRMSATATAEGSQQTTRALLVEKVPYLLVAVVFSVIAFVGQRRGGAVRSIEEYSILQRLLNACVSYAAYLKKAFWPADLAVFYPYPNHLPWGAAISSLLLLGALTVWIVRVRKRHPYLLSGWLWYLGILVPVLGLVQIGRQRMADRYMYFPLIGLTLGLTWLVLSWCKGQPLRQRLSRGLGALIIIALAMTSRVQVSYWKDSETLFTHAGKVAESSLAYTKLGYEKAQQGELTAAANLFHRALDLDPEYVAALSSLGNTWLARGNPQQAIRYFQKVIALDPEHAEAQYNLGIVYSLQGDPSDAVEHYDQALRVDPENAMVHANLGIALLELERVGQAKHHLERAVALEPELPQAHYYLAKILAADSREAEAIKHLQIVLRNRPGSADVYRELANLHERLGDLKRAAEFRKLAD